MKKFIKYLPWILFGISFLIIGLFTISLNIMKNDAVQQIKNIQTVEEKFQATRTTYDDQLESLRDNLQKVEVARDLYAEQLQAAEDSLACPNKDLFKPDYIYDANMSKALSNYLTATEGGEIKSATWETVWEGSRSSLFTIILTQKQGEVGHKFIVYHNEAHFPKNRVFSLSRQCWLDG